MPRAYRALTVTIALVLGAGFLLLPDAGFADPPHWAKAKGHRKKHSDSEKHRYDTHHRRKHHDDQDDREDAEEGEVGYWDDPGEGSTYPAPSFRAPWPGYIGDNRLPVFRNGVCIPRPSAADAGAALGQGLASQVTGGNTASAVLGGILGAALGSQIDGGTRAADEDCTYQVLEGAADRQRIAWDADAATRYQVTPVRSFNRNGLACRELVTQRVQGGRIRESHRTACRDRDGRWQIVD